MLIPLALFLAQTTVPEPADQAIVVEGERRTDAEIRTEAQAFVRAVAAAPGSADQLARWNQPICAKVIGATPGEEKPVLDRIREVAVEAGIRIARKRNCEPNILVAFTDDPSGVVRAVFQKRPHAARAVPALVPPVLVVVAMQKLFVKGLVETEK